MGVHRQRLINCLPDLIGHRTILAQEERLSIGTVQTRIIRKTVEQSLENDKGFIMAAQRLIRACQEKIQLSIPWPARGPLTQIGQHFRVCLLITDVQVLEFAHQSKIDNGTPTETNIQVNEHRKQRYEKRRTPDPCSIGTAHGCRGAILPRICK